VNNEQFKKWAGWEAKERSIKLPWPGAENLTFDEEAHWNFVKDMPVPGWGCRHIFNPVTGPISEDWPEE